MRIVGVMTEDFHFFHGVVKRLKERKEPFVSLGFDDHVPWNVSVVITTKDERSKVPHSMVAASDDPDEAINIARSLLRGRKYGALVVGIDPGRTIGIVIIGNGRVIHSGTFECPEDTADKVIKMTSGLEFDEVVVRIGHGDRTIRNRIIRSVWSVADRVEIVDETNTTMNTETPDIDAAILISKTKGYDLERPPDIRPTAGELREIQRRSRIESEGAITIGKELAGCVARGEMTMSDALTAHKAEEKKRKRV
ncbi:MAG: hypothetical protein HPY73_06335 [Methanomassiliicoccales archaeon]|nr:MAG: hypothetical protein HPY73_06335 [Methanomassiliicoccales archaeon]